MHFGQGLQGVSAPDDSPSPLRKEAAEINALVAKLRDQAADLNRMAAENEQAHTRNPAHDRSGYFFAIAAYFTAEAEMRRRVEPFRQACAIVRSREYAKVREEMQTIEQEVRETLEWPEDSPVPLLLFENAPRWRRLRQTLAGMTSGGTNASAVRANANALKNAEDQAARYATMAKAEKRKAASRAKEKEARTARAEAAEAERVAEAEARESAVSRLLGTGRK